MRVNNRVLFSLAFLLSLFILSPSHAQTDPGGAVAHKNAKATSEELNQYASEDDYVIKDGYVAPTYQRLSKLYWALAIFDLGNDAAIDRYLMVNECELYSKYYNSDFELIDLRAATRQSIMQNMASFDKQFEIVIPLGLDRYDIGSEKFKLDPDSAYLGVKRLEVNPNNESTEVCHRASNIPGYPKNFVLSLSRPFLLTEIPMPPEVAQAYIEESQRLSEMRQNNYRFHISKFGRVAFLRLKVSIVQFRDYYQMPNRAPLADLFGTIDGYEIYADREKKFLLYKTEARKDHILTRRKRTAPQPDEAATMEEAEETPTEKSEQATETP